MGTLTEQERLQQNRGVIKVSDGERFVEVTENGELKILDSATTTDQGRSQNSVRDVNLLDVSKDILTYLKIIVSQNNETLYQWELLL